MNELEKQAEEKLNTESYAKADSITAELTQSIISEVYDATIGMPLNLAQERVCQRIAEEFVRRAFVLGYTEGYEDAQNE